MVCSDVSESVLVSRKPSSESLSVSVEKRLNALSPSERKHFLESVAYNKEMLDELAQM